MARTYVQVTIDDLTGKAIPADQAETIRFSINDKAYSIDLDKASAAEFHTILQRYTAAASKAAPAKPARRGAERHAHDELAEIRRWGHENGYNVSARGRISAEVREAYNNR